jgi:phosphatidylglycerophosphatase A
MASTEPAAERKRTLLAWAVGTVCGAGLAGPAPGTNGSAVAALAWWAIAPHLHGLDPRLALGAMTLLATAIGIPAATRVAREAEETDPGCVVIDEVAGQWLTLLLAPAGWKTALAGFILFRAFDILKPFPVRRLERLREGWGIVLDDLGAGVYAMIVLALLVHFRVLG